MTSNRINFVLRLTIFNLHIFQAASTTLHCAICPFSMDLSGKYFDNEAVCPTSPLAEDEQKQHQLIEISRSILESKGVLKR
jgi:hypothetical protein